MQTAGVLNRTTLGLNAQELYAKHEPILLPWLKDVHLPIGAIEQLYCTYDSLCWDEDGRRMSSDTVTLNVLAKDGSQRPLARGLPRDHGLFIEQQLEEWLRISPARVPGQVG